jgi:hypothetical protein
MRATLTIILSSIAIFSLAQKSGSKDIILQQLRNTHSVRQWFVPLNDAVRGLTAEQAAYIGAGNHSIGQLTHHILFWTEHHLNNFKTGATDKFTGDNEMTFEKFDQAQWENLVLRVDVALSDLEKWVEGASDEQLQEYIAPLSNLALHNAYHIGQIISVRKAQGSWK